MDINTNNTINDESINYSEIFAHPYNYCDYWCERCIAQEQCQIFNKQVTEEEEEFSLLMLDDDFDKVLLLIYKYMEVNNIDTLKRLDDEEAREYFDDEVDEDNEDDILFTQIRRQIEGHPLRLMCLDYLDKSAEFFEHYLERYITPPLLIDAFSNLGWYRSLLPVKMDRTLHSLYEFGLNEEEFSLQDAFLTSLIVYKSLRKSLAAVKELKDYLVDYQETLTELEDLLITIKTGLRHEFPFWIILPMLYFYSSPQRYAALN